MRVVTASLAFILCCMKTMENKALISVHLSQPNWQFVNCATFKTRPLCVLLSVLPARFTTSFGLVFLGLGLRLRVRVRVKVKVKVKG